MKQLPDNSVDSIVTDPPYGISFMAKKWDYDVPKVEVWKEAMRVLKHGGHALIACGTRTQHRMVVNIEDAGFEIRDVVSWIYGSGFPKSLNISKAIDATILTGGSHSRNLKAVLTSRDLVAERCGNSRNNGILGEDIAGRPAITAPATEAAKQWDGWGTALKPACEFFTLARKPLSEKTVAANVLKWGTGGINIDGCRVGTETIKTCAKGKDQSVTSNKNGDERDDKGRGWNGCPESTHQGRFPANLIHDGSQQVLELFPETNKDSAARFFYCPKASKKDRDEGNNHPTVKPTALMQYLCRLITPKGGVVLDPYMGSGSTGKAAVKEGFSFVGCELDEEYYKIAQARIQR
jgi:site-specific DNA-methyltransferase (adenine-specific)